MDDKISQAGNSRDVAQYCEKVHVLNAVTVPGMRNNDLDWNDLCQLISEQKKIKSFDLTALEK